jgi:hypothetical protein
MFRRGIMVVLAAVILLGIGAPRCTGKNNLKEVENFYLAFGPD